MIDCVQIERTWYEQTSTIHYFTVSQNKANKYNTSFESYWSTQNKGLTPAKTFLYDII